MVAVLREKLEDVGMVFLVVLLVLAFLFLGVYDWIRVRVFKKEPLTIFSDMDAYPSHLEDCVY